MKRTALLLLLAAAPASAHSGTGLPGGFAAGVLHPLTGPDHLLAMVAVGLWGAFLGRPLLYLLPIIFPLMMVVGAEIGMLDLPLPPVELGIAVSVLALGTAIASAWKAPIWLACPIVGLFALFHGYAHGRELPSAADPLGYAAGFVLATGSLHVAGIALGELRMRSLGVGIAGAGLWFLIRAVA
ncbi:MAG TPA: HupE/UreJ family protein [Magnetospirillaceae bacterium]|nr:HupE/UreJ family protein [Magnetospirillaceae bacterium]